MNTTGLARYYESLSPRERFPLMVAARLRGDDVEAERLVRSAPMQAFAVANYHGLAGAMGELSLLHLCRLLDGAARLGQAEGLLASLRRYVKDRDRRQQREFQIAFDARLEAYSFLVAREAWERFCAELHLDPEALLRILPGYATVQVAAASARVLAFSPEKAAEAFRLRWGDGAAVPTVETALADLRQALAARESWWT
jgi:hypothetical protein